MDQLDAMRTFLAVADRVSFAEAARALRLSPAAATRAVAATRGGSGAEPALPDHAFGPADRAGAVYAERCRRMLAGSGRCRGAEVRGEDAAPRGLLSLTAPVLFGRLHVAPIAEVLTAAHPDLSVRLTLVDRVTHLVEEGFDVAVRIGPLADSALIAVPVARVRRIAGGEPCLPCRARHAGAPARPQAHRIVSFEGVDDHAGMAASAPTGGLPLRSPRA